MNTTRLKQQFIAIEKEKKYLEWANKTETQNYINVKFGVFSLKQQNYQEQFLYNCFCIISKSIPIK